jgi:Zn-dependent protease
MSLPNAIFFDEMCGKFSSRALVRFMMTWIGRWIHALRGVPCFIWTLLSMVFSIAVYSRTLGWTMASGFIGLLLVHECGHLIMASLLGVPVSAPIFIPYAGAVMTIGSETINRWSLARIGMAGPIAGTMGVIVCYIGYRHTGSAVLATLACGASVQNLFNLIPVGSLDGGHISGAISRVIWIPGYLLLCLAGWFFHVPIVWILLVLLLPQVCGVFQKPLRVGNVRKPRASECLMLVISYAALVFGLVLILIAALPGAHSPLGASGTTH